MASEAELLQCLKTWKRFDDCKTDLQNKDNALNEQAMQKDRDTLKKIEALVADNIKQLEFQKSNSTIQELNRKIGTEISTIQSLFIQIQTYFQKNTGNIELDQVAWSLKKVWIDVKWKMSERGMTNTIDPESIKSSIGEKIKTIFADYNNAEKSAQERMLAEQKTISDAKKAEELRIAQEKAQSQVTNKVGMVDALLRLKQYGRWI